MVTELNAIEINAIEINNVRFSYPERPDNPVLDIPSWSLPKGERAFLHGPSGGGKSTLLNLLSGLLPATAGSVDILGRSVNGLSARQRDRFRAQHIGFVFQQFNLIPYLNAVENIRLAKHFSRNGNARVSNGDIQQLLAQLNITQSEWATLARNLSIGQQQRVAIARALINKPQLLIADEPTSSLDQANRDAFMALLMKIVEERTVTEGDQVTLLFVSHDMALSRYFSRVEALCDINRAGESS